jgi:DNA-directed RNA polymerase subunit RPC12/RpoP
VDVPTEITCVECGGTAGLLSAPPPDDFFRPGDVVAYVCADCDHRFDIVLDEVESPGEA